MVAHFKARVGESPVHEMTHENVESLLGRRWPWFRRGQYRDDDRHYAVCPYCDNPIQLKGVYRRGTDSPRPYGSHIGTPIDGFPYFDEIDLEFCPYRLRQHSHGRDSRRPMGPAAKQLVNMAVNEFDRIILILRDDFGFPFSNQFARKMLEQWFDSKGYLYTGAHLRNLPWMVAYFGPAQSLYRQYIGNNTDLVNGVRKTVPNAVVNGDGQLVCEGWCAIDLQCLHHKIGEITATGSLTERMTIRVQDFSCTNFPEKAPTIYQKTITFDPDRFERLIHTASSHANRSTVLLQIAQTVADRWRI